ncbi:ABC transporter ATP-binding protein [Sinimarinibacterium sp. CAU 1509]|uniref:ABC transporter ATP-binding protein n=1 Tax=Sinimarinibacterium sp. CAU 1509 TaxID=2562283 RepID=UPI0010ABAEC0|nr:ABC transporter ATP-binding protein [Sinimarinibacterium sp. CAU 1509]TJY56253.1 ABC transporter ATP-binding protein [Sinimarinibacterium sp. CAU 1509]
MSTSHPVIEIRALHKRFGAVHAVAGVDLAVERGELFGLIGHNGAGKSTLFKLLLGLIAPTSGDIHVEGKSLRGAAFREVRRHLGYLPENVVLYDNLNGRETLRFFADLKGVPRAQCDGVLERVGLGDAGRRRVREYSKGMRQRLGFAQALLGQPRLLFLDEPTNGLDPEGIREFYAILHALRESGVTILLTSHILSEIQQRVDRLAIMKSGRIQAVGTVQQLRESTDLPLKVSLRFARGDDGLQALLRTLPARTLRFDAGEATLQCTRQAKMEVLTALTALNGRVLDLHVREPSLEDVFLGHASEEPR